jgi:hypothetical protein
MELNRNQFFFIGLLLLLLGLQFRMVASYTLTSEATRFLAERLHGPTLVASADGAAGPAGSNNFPQKTFSPPNWLGLCLMSVGGVLVLHSLAMRKPGG